MRLRAKGFPAMRRPVIVDDRIATFPLSREAQRALENALIASTSAIDKAMSPFGLSAHDIVMPAFEHVMYWVDTPSDGFDPVRRITEAAMRRFDRAIAALKSRDSRP